MIEVFRECLKVEKPWFEVCKACCDVPTHQWRVVSQNVRVVCDVFLSFNCVFFLKSQKVEKAKSKSISKTFAILNQYCCHFNVKVNNKSFCNILRNYSGNNVLYLDKLVLPQFKADLA